MQVHNVTKNKVPFVHQGKPLRKQKLDGILKKIHKHIMFPCFHVSGRFWIIHFCHVCLQVP